MTDKPQRVGLPTADEPRCGTCRFYREEWDESESNKVAMSGLCRRHPPTWVAPPGTNTREDYGDTNWE